MMKQQTAHTSLAKGLRSATISFMDWIRDLLGWSRSPLSREGFSLVRVKRAPFGWREAIKRSRRG